MSFLVLISQSPFDRALFGLFPLGYGGEPRNGVSSIIPEINFGFGRKKGVDWIETKHIFGLYCLSLPDYLYNFFTHSTLSWLILKLLYYFIQLGLGMF